MLVCDTSVVYAALDSTELDHAACAELLATADGVVVPAPVLVELDQLGRSRGMSNVTVAVIESIRDSSVLIAPTDLEGYERIQELVVRYADFPLSLVDAAVVAVAEQLGQTTIATLDRRHFSVVRPLHTAAFTLVP